jgi:hypothetical protein
MVARYLRFHQNNEGFYFPHEQKRDEFYGFGRGSRGWNWDDDDIAGWEDSDSAVDPDVYDFDFATDDPSPEDLRRLEEAMDRREAIASLDRDWVEAVLSEGRM